VVQKVPRLCDVSPSIRFPPRESPTVSERTEELTLKREAARPRSARRHSSSDLTYQGARDALFGIRT